MGLHGENLNLIINKEPSHSRLPDWPPLLGQRVEIISEGDCPHHPRVKAPDGMNRDSYRYYGRVLGINVRREPPLTDHPYWIEADSGATGYVSLYELEPVDA